MIFRKMGSASRSKTANIVQEEITNEIENHTRYRTSGLLFGVYQFLPYEVIRLLPFVREDVKQLLHRKQPVSQETLEPIECSQAPIQSSTRLEPDSIPYSSYRCWHGEPLSCDWTQQTIEDNPTAKYCQECGFPALLRPKAEILGNRGRYRIVQGLERRGWGRLYEAIHLGSQQSVVIKEYVLPDRLFNPEEIRQVKQRFEQLAGLKLADGRVQDFRLIQLWEAISDRTEERCYAITQGNEAAYPTLRTYLNQMGAMSPMAVRQVLSQVLQSLIALHSQKFCLPTGQVQSGFAHGNLSLDSLLILPDRAGLCKTPQLLIYLSDLALWEQLFLPPPRTIKTSEPRQDLLALGQVAFYLLAGRSTDAQGRSLNPRQFSHWPNADSELEGFIRRLLEMDTPFETAAAARQVLLNLPIATSVEPAEEAVVASEAHPSHKVPAWLWWSLLIVLFAALGAGLAWWWLKRQSAPVADEPTLCCVADIPAVPDGRFQYTFGRQSIWHYIWREKNLIAKDKTLESAILSQFPKLQLLYKPVGDRPTALDRVRSGQADFAITSLDSELETVGDRALNQAVFAYDGLAVFVAFSYEKRQQGLPKFLNGKITLSQLRQLYTGQITNWQQLGGPDLPVRLYNPDDPEAIHLFEQRVLQDSFSIQQFRALQSMNSFSNDSQNTHNQAVGGIRSFSTFELFRRIIHDFEADRVGSIGFGSLSQVFGQCAVYPLAIADDPGKAVQPLIQASGQPITPAIDLCDDKGNYRLNIRALQTGSYRLAYPLAVIYPYDNSQIDLELVSEDKIS
jgi:hypothetical protein